MEELIQALPLIILFSAVLLIVVYKKRKKTTIVSRPSQTDMTFEDKMLLLQEDSNKRLKGIDTTLDWFFWIMVVVGIWYLIAFVMASMNPY